MTETTEGVSRPAEVGKKKIPAFLSVSCGATVLMVFYLGIGMLNLYKLMYPLAFLDVKSSDALVGPLWNQESNLRMKVYLSKRKQFRLDFLESEYQSKAATQGKDRDEDAPALKKDVDSFLLWESDLTEASLSKSVLLTTLDCGDDVDAVTCPAVEVDPSYQYASRWLDQAEDAAQTEGGIMSELSASAGEGIESTSALLTVYNIVSDSVGRALSILWTADPSENDDGEQEGAGKSQDRTIITVSRDSQLWVALQSTTLHVHVLVVRDGTRHTTLVDAQRDLERSARSHSLVLGHIEMVKYNWPHHIVPPKRILFHDVVFLLKLIVSWDLSSQPPWDMEYHQPEEFAKYQKARNQTEEKIAVRYWKPEVSIKYVNDDVWYPTEYAGLSGFDTVRLDRERALHPSGFAYKPAVYADELRLTVDRHIPLNETVTSLPLRISFDRNDMEKKQTASTATAGGIGPARWRLLTHLTTTLEAQRELGFEESDIDDMRRLVADTNVTLLAITMLASGLHLLFEFLTLKSEVSFWRNNKDLTGLSVRSLFLDMIGQVIILLFLLETNTSLLMTVPSGLGCLIALWKCQRGAGFKFVRLSTASREITPSWWNVVPRLFGYDLCATRLHVAKTENTSLGKQGSTVLSPDQLAALTIETDEIATRTLGVVLLPLVLSYALYSLILEEQTGWYSWLITTASSAVYALGFALMTPQLFLNYKLKSVAHLPWRVLVYKFLNTFIDDLFAFIIRMPTLARISCFRDDIVFLVYLYQRWLYPVDSSRPVEGGDGPTPAKATETKGKLKKNQ